MKKFALLGMSVVLFACTDEVVDSPTPLPDDANIIHIGGITTKDVPTATVQAVTRAAVDTLRAEDVVWLQGALKGGLDITYYNVDKQGTPVAANNKVAILKWTGNKIPNPYGADKRGEYTFNYKVEGTPAVWYDNGPHYFEGQYVPDLIREGVNLREDLSTDQHNGSDYTYDSEGNPSGTIGNYTLLGHYIGMPPNWYTSATIDQILLPFKHRLSRVLAYVLIDPDLKNLDNTDVTLKGYENKDQEGSYIGLEFENVKVLKQVKEETVDLGGGITTTKLTPEWMLGRSVKPHFYTEYNKSVDVYERAIIKDETDVANQAFIVYTDLTKDKRIYPNDSVNWKKAHSAYTPTSTKYSRKEYKKVPVYDIIVRPTYTNVDSVMYDEAGYPATKETLYKEKNSIDFEVTLSNGLEYTKRFEFDLNANWETVVYLIVDREGVDYDSSTSIAWEETKANDKYYGINNDLGHNLSIAGSSWQRAYRNKIKNHGVTDGNDYGGYEDEEGYVGQYVDNATWIAAFAQAHKDGAHHGDYFVLDEDIEIDVTLLPADFVFTGHLDGRGHKITLTGVGNTAYKPAENLNSALYIKSGSSYAAYTLPQLYTKEDVAAVYYTEDELITDSGKTYIIAKLTKDADDNYIFTDDALVPDDRIKIPAHPEFHSVNMTTLTLEQLITGEYYTAESVSERFIYQDLYAVSHTGTSYLFKGLNAIYTTAQEENKNISKWEANVHIENSKWVPVKGYRAELLNTTVANGTFFPTDAVLSGISIFDTSATVTGYIYNCFDSEHVAPSNPLSNVVPIPQY